MIGETPHAADTNDGSPASPPASDVVETAEKPAPAPMPREIGGRDGPEPTRYGDWEKNGRCIDF